MAVVLTYGLSTAFLAWGMSTPPLDRVWQLHHELKIGKEKKLKKRDREILEAAMERYPDLASALLPGGQIGMISAHRDGWIDTPHVIIVRTPASDAQAVVLEVQTPAQNIPFSVELAGSGWKRKVRVERRGRLEIPLPEPPEHAELLTLSLSGKGLKDDPSSIAVRVTFSRPGKPDAPSMGEPADDEDDEGEEGEADP